MVAHVNIGIVGGGGIGSYYAGVLSRAGHAVRLLTRGDHLAAITARGLEVRMPDETFVATIDASDDERHVAGCDAVVVAVKGYSLPDIAPSLVAAAASGASIVPLLNGVDVVERLESLGVPRGALVGGLTAVSVVRTAPGVVERRSPFARATLGELDGVGRARTTQLVAALVEAGIEARVSDTIALDLWRKFAFIVPMSVGCGLTRQPAGRVFATDGGRELVAGSLREIVAVSRAGDTALTDDDESRILADLFGVPAAMRPSFLLDLERGGQTELDLLAGTVCRLGRKRGVPTPIHDVATAVFDIATRPPSA